MTARYTTQLQAGLGMIDETRSLLDLWQPGTTPASLSSKALESGRFPGMSARRVRNVVTECFAPRFLHPATCPAEFLKQVADVLTARELQQLFFLLTCRANTILADFVREVYWGRYEAGRETLTAEDSRDFVVGANQDGKTAKQWSESTIRRVSSYLLGACVDFGLLQRLTRNELRMLGCRIEPRVAAYLAYDLHFDGQGDNRMLSDPDWQLFGLQRDDVLAELRRLAMQGLFLVQSAGGVTRMSWSCKNREELANVLAQR